MTPTAISLENQFVGGSSPPARIICHCSSVGRALQDNVQAVIGSSPISGKLIFHEDAIASVVSGVMWLEVLEVQGAV